MKRKEVDLKTMYRNVYNRDFWRPFQEVTNLPVEIDVDMENRGRLIRTSRAGDTVSQEGIFMEGDGVKVLNKVPLRKNAKYPPKPPRPLLDPYHLRDAFERVRSDAEIENFLTLCGPFCLPGIPQVISLAQFRIAQRFIDDVRSENVGKAFLDFIPSDGTDNILDPRLDPLVGKRNTPRRLKIVCHTALEVIGATLLVDRMNSREVDRCPWCEVLFDPVVKGQRRKYCSPGHMRLDKKDEQRKMARGTKKARADHAEA